MSVVVCEKPVALEPATVRIPFLRPLCAPRMALVRGSMLSRLQKKVRLNVVRVVPIRAAMKWTGLACDEKAVVCMRNE